VVEAVFTNNVDPEAYIAEKGLMMVTDDKVVIDAVNSILSGNPDAVADYKAGKVKAYGFLMSQVMRKLSGSGNPDMVKEILKKSLENS